MSKEVGQGHESANKDDDLHMYEKGDEPMIDRGVDAQSLASGTPVGSSQSLNETNSSSKNTKNSKGFTSDVWKDMTRTTIDGVVVAICNHCKIHLKGGSSAGTSHLRNHISRCKKKKNVDIRQCFLHGGEKKKDGKVEYRTFAFDEDRSRTDLANMIVLHEYPLSIVNHHGFRVYSHNLQPLFKVRSRNTIKSDILKIYHSKREKLVEDLERLDSRVSITTDMWSAKPTKKGYMAITAHYIDSSWVLQNRLVRFIYVPPPHNSDVLTEDLVEALMELNLDRKLSTVTVDNASSNDAMLGKVVDRLDPSTLIMRGKVLHMRCCAHILNLIVKDGLEVIKKEVENVRNSVVYWIGSRSRIQKFEDTARQLSIQNIKSLILDCPTRWNSTYLMLERALEYKVVFPRLKQKERSYTCLPDEEDWRRVEIITEKLKLFYNATLMFSGTLYPTANEFFLKICEIKLALNSWVVDCEFFISDMAKVMIEKYDKYWSECHEVLGIACVLDPRYKMKLIEYFMPLIHGELASFEIEKIRNSCYDLLNEYQSKERANENVVCGTSSSLSSGATWNANDTLLGFDMFVNNTSRHKDVKSELDHYLDELVLPRTLHFDVLGWWKTNGVKFPTLQKIARDVLAIPVTSVASEAAFSTSGRLVSPHRSRLAPNTLEALMCTQNWLRNEKRELSLEVGSEENIATCDDDMDVNE